MIQYQEYSFPLNLPFPQSVENRGRSESKICKPFVAEEKEQKPSTFKPYVIHENMVSQTSSTNLENRLLVFEKGGVSHKWSSLPRAPPSKHNPVFCSLHS